jgi:hypothetical protein
VDILGIIPIDYFHIPEAGDVGYPRREELAPFTGP